MRTLLLADDNLTVQRVIALTFAQEPIRVVAVRDGQVAIEKMAAEQPDIVLADTTLPQVNGYDLARFMRGNAGLKSVPVLLLSGAFETVDAARLAASGANGVIEKPVEPTLVINRVKELLGLKTDDKPSTTGRMLTPADNAGEKKVFPPPRAAMTGRTTSAGDQSTPVVEPATPAADESAAKPADYLDTLDSAFASLDRKLSSGVEGAKTPRNPSGPLAPSDSAADPRSPGQKPPAANATAANPVFEIDDDWFGTAESQARADARAGRREAAPDASAQSTPAETPAPNPIFEVDEEWFAADEKARTAKREEEQQLAREMGIHDVDLPPVVPAVELPAAASNSDFDFGIADFQAVTGTTITGPAQPEPPAAVEVPPAEPEQVPPVEADRPMEELHAVIPPPEPVTPAPLSSEALDQVAAHIVQRLQDGVLRDQWRDAMSVVAGLKVNDEKIEQIAARVADRLNPGVIEDRLREVNASMSSLQITDEKLDQIAARVTERLPMGAVEERLREVSAAVVSAQITDERLDQIAARVTERLPLGPLADRLGEVNAAVASSHLTDEKLDQIAARVEGRLNLGAVDERLRQVHASVAAAQITAEMLEHVAARVADRLQLGAVEDRLRDLTAAISSVQMSDDKLDHIASRVGERLHLGAVEDRLRDLTAAVSAVQITDAKLEQLASAVAARIQAEGLGDQFREAMLTAVRDTVRSVVSETSERLVRAEIERIKSEEAAREDNVE